MIAHGVQGPWIRRQALHAACLQLAHPVTGTALSIEGESSAEHVLSCMYSMQQLILLMLILEYARAFA